MSIRLKSSDGKFFDTDYQITKCSGTIKALIERLAVGEGEGEDAVIPLPNVNSVILSKVLQWANFHKNDPVRDPVTLKDDTSNEKRVNISPWDVNFLIVDQSTLFDLILVANYLDIQGLLDVTSQTVANRIKGKAPEEIRYMFAIKNDFIATEKETENEWHEDK